MIDRVWVTRWPAIQNHVVQVTRPFEAARWQEVIQVEEQELAGLDHVDDSHQVMATTVDRGAGSWGAGDLAGLAYLGQEAGCLTVPEPRDVGEVD